MNFLQFTAAKRQQKKLPPLAHCGWHKCMHALAHRHPHTQRRVRTHTHMHAHTNRTVDTWYISRRSSFVLLLVLATPLLLEHAGLLSCSCINAQTEEKQAFIWNKIKRTHYLKARNLNKPCWDHFIIAGIIHTAFSLTVSHGHTNKYGSDLSQVLSCDSHGHSVMVQQLCLGEDLEHEGLTLLGLSVSGDMILTGLIQWRGAGHACQHSDITIEMWK